MKYQVIFVYSNGLRRNVDIKKPTKFQIIKALFSIFPERVKEGLIIEKVFMRSINNDQVKTWDLEI